MNKIIGLIILALFVVGCGSELPATNVITDTLGLTPTITNPPPPTDTPGPTPTITNTPPPTNTPRPTNTPKPTPTCSERHGNEFVEQLEDINLRWDDAFAIADSTGRGYLAGPVADLQEIRRDALKIEVPECAEPAHEELILYMEGVVDGYLAFMSQEADAAVSRKFDTAFEHFTSFLEEMEKIGVEDFYLGG